MRSMVVPLGAVTVPVAGEPLVPSFQPMTDPAASSCAAVGATAVGVSPELCCPRNDTPTLLVLKPWAWPPITAPAMLPVRASQIRPNRSITKL